MWWNIIKESRQTSRTMGSIDWENEAIPEEEETNCLKKLKEYYNRAKNNQTIKDFNNAYQLIKLN